MNKNCGSCKHFDYTSPDNATIGSCGWLRCQSLPQIPVAQQRIHAQTRGCPVWAEKPEPNYPALWDRTCIARETAKECLQIIKNEWQAAQQSLTPFMASRVLRIIEMKFGVKTDPTGVYGK